MEKKIFEESIIISGQRFDLVSDVSQEYIRELGKYINDRLDTIYKSKKPISTKSACILLSLNIADDFFLEQKNREKNMDDFRQKLEEEYKQQISELKNKNKLISEYEDKIDNLEIDKININNKSNENYNLFLNLKKELKLLQEAKNKLIEENKNIKNDFTKIEEEKNTLQEELKRVNIQIEEKNNELKSLNTKLELTNKETISFKSDIEKSLEDIKNKDLYIERLKKENKNINTSLESSKREIKNSNFKIIEMEKTLNEANKSLDSHNSAVSRLDNRIKTLSVKENQYRNTIADLNSSLSTKNKEIEKYLKLQDRYSALEKDYNLVLENEKEYLSQIHRLNENSNEAESELLANLKKEQEEIEINYKTKIQNLEDKYNKLNSDYLLKTNELDTLLAKNIEITSCNRQNEKELKEKETKINTLENHIKEFSHQIETLNNTTEQTNIDNRIENAYKDKINELIHNEQKLNKEIYEKEKEVKDIKFQMYDLRKDEANLEDIIAKQEKELINRQKENEILLQKLENLDGTNQSNTQLKPNHTSKANRKRK